MKYILYHGIPIVLFACGFTLQSICLHITTKLYIDDFWEQSQLNNTYNEGRLIDIIGSNIKISYVVPIILLDYIGFMPFFVFVCLTIISESSNKKNMNVYLKTMMIATILAIFKGILDVATIIPDSSGINMCKSRLTVEIYNYIKSLDFKNNFFRTLKEIIKMEIIKINGKKVRYCSDMLLSGHIYFVVLFCLGNYKMIIRSCDNLKGLRLWITKISLILYVIIAICLIEINKFHYTVDILLSIIFTILLWQNAFIDNIASKYGKQYYENDINTIFDCESNEDSSSNE